MGTLRYVLALLVVLTHTGFNIGRFIQGVLAVVIFFMISGFVMTALIQKSYPTPDRMPGFLLDRVMRLFPQFLFYLALTSLLMHFFVPTYALPPELDLELKYIVLNYLMLPMGFYMYVRPDKWLIMPQGWSLGLELTFYLVLPFILAFRVRGLMFALSMVVFILACVGTIPTNTWSYRLLPGTLFIFLCGSYMFSGSPIERRIALGAAMAVCAVLLVGSMLIPQLGWPQNSEVLVGVLVGIPLVYWLTSVKTGKLDAFLGNLSYGIYLNHFFLMWVAEFFKLKFQSAEFMVFMLIATNVFAAISFYAIERPVIRLRHKLRRQGGMGAPAAA